MMELREVFDAVTGYVNRRFYQKREHLFESSGAVSRLMPMLTNAAGKLDGSFLSGVAALLSGGNTFTGDQVVDGNVTLARDVNAPVDVVIDNANTGSSVRRRLIFSRASTLLAFLQHHEPDAEMQLTTFGAISVAFATNGARRYTIDANGAHGFGVVPDANSTVKVQSIAASREAVRVDTAASPTVAAVAVGENGTTRIALLGTIAGGGGTDYFAHSILDTLPFDNGTSIGARIRLRRNNNSSTPAAGNVLLENRGGTQYYLWPDASGNLRIGTTVPTSANDTSGTVVGTQTSMAAAKDIDETLPDWRASLGHIIEAVQGGALRSWKYKSGAYNNEHYPIGIVTDYAKRYGQDENRSLNVPVAIGDLMGAVVTLTERVAKLEMRLDG